MKPIIQPKDAGLIEKKRLDIEALRIIAALFVLFYHAAIPGFDAGFIGVDLFLVISGFVVTKSWLNLRDNGATGLKLLATFLWRRVQRIMPAMVLVIAATLIVGYFLLPPQALFSAALQSVAALLHFLNITLGMTGGYFNESSAALPLTHLWTISLEFQFYLLLALLGVAITIKNHLLMVIAVAVSASSFLTISAENSISSNPYLLLQYRFWEFGLGALVALVVPKQFQVTLWVKTITTALAIVLIGYGLATADQFTQHPGALLLAPVLAAILVVATPYSRENPNFTQTKSFLIAAGATSYPIYLWHQPIFSFAKYAAIQVFNPLIQIALISIVLMLSFATHKLIDRKRAKKVTKPRYLRLSFALNGFALLGSATLTGFLIKHEGYPNRLNEPQQVVYQYFENAPPQYQYFRKTDLLAKLAIGCDFYDNLSALELKPHDVPRANIDVDCYQPQNHELPTILIWGSSHAMHLRYGIEVNLAQTANILQITSSNCPPRLNQQSSRIDYCRQSNWFAQNTIQKLKPDLVILSGLKDYSPGNLTDLSTWLKSAGVMAVVVAGPTLTWNAPLPQLMFNDLSGRFDYPKTKSLAFDGRKLTQDTKLKEQFKDSPLLTYVSYHDAFCDKDGCTTYFANDFLKNPTTWDSSHLTDYGSEMFFNNAMAAAIFDALMNNMSKKN